MVDESANAERLRLKGAVALHGICQHFVETLNSKLSIAAVMLDPPDYPAGRYKDGGSNLFQINLRGRLLQIEFTAAEDLYSTEEFRRAYVLQGTMRSFNQELLQQDTVDEHAIFYCPHDDGPAWCYFDSRSYRTGAITSDFLASQLERLII